MKRRNGIYALNNNKAIAVILDAQNYNELVEGYQELRAENDRLQDQLIELEAEKRITMRIDYLADHEVRGGKSRIAELPDSEDE